MDLKIFNPDWLKACKTAVYNPTFLHSIETMKNNRLIQTARSILLFIAIAALSTASAQEFVEGVDYIVLPGEAQVQADGRVEVVEFFWFGCPSCFRFEPYLLAWKVPETIHFVNVPATLSESWIFHAHAYYAMELMGLKQQLMQKFYDELHVNRSRIRKVDDFADWAAAQADVDPDKVASTLNSFATKSKVSQAAHLAANYKITGVPTLVVAGKYKTSPSMVQSETKALRVVEYLAEKVLGN